MSYDTTKCLRDLFNAVEQFQRAQKEHRAARRGSAWVGYKDPLAGSMPSINLMVAHSVLRRAMQAADNMLPCELNEMDGG